MRLQVVGAGLGRTGTASLKQALELLTGGRCYHMFEVFQHPDDVAVWHEAVRGGPVDWDALMGDYSASVDWPAAAYWSELAELNPDAIVLLSTRSSPEVWWGSMQKTIVQALTEPLPEPDPVVERHRAMVHELLERRLTPDWREPAAAMAAYQRHNERVRREAPAERLLDWQPGDGWEPICAAMGVPVPEQPFPHENSSEQFRGNIEEHAGR